MTEITIHTLGQIKARDPYVVLGLPGTGLVGSVAAAQLVESLKMEFVGYISSPDFAPLAAIHDYMPMPAARIHYSSKYNVVVILSEMNIPVASSMALADKIYEFSKMLNACMVVSLGGISLKEQPDQVYSIASDQKLMRPLIEKKLAKPIREGATSGVSGILLARGVIDKFPMLSILAESSEEYLDPRAAANALRALAAIIKTRIDTGRLEEEAVEIAAEMREKILKSKTPKKIGPADASMYG